MNIDNVFSNQGILKENESKETIGLFGYIYVPKSSSYYLKSAVINLVAKIASLSIALNIPKIVFYENIKEVNIRSKDILFYESKNLSISTRENILKLSAHGEQWTLIERFILSNSDYCFNKSTEIEYRDLLKFSRRIEDFHCINGKKSNIPLDIQLDNIFNYPDWYNQEIRKYLPAKFNMIIDQEMSNAEFLSVINLTSRFALEHKNIYQSVVNRNSDNQLNIKINSNKEHKSEIKKVNKNTFVISCKEDNLYNFTLDLSKEYPFIKSPFLIKNITQWFKDFLNLENDTAHLIEAIKYNENENVEVFFELGPKDNQLGEFQKVGDEFCIKVKSRKESRQVKRWEHKPAWEVEKVKSIIQKLLQEKKIKSTNRIEVFVSENKVVREKLKKDLNNLLSKNDINVEIVIYRAYKQAISWIEEIVIPEIKDKRIKKIEIGFRPFLSSINDEWEDSYGAVPVMDNFKQNKSNKYLELPTRLLQELYPIDDILEKEIGLCRDDVIFYALDNDSAVDYKFKAFNKEFIYEKDFNVSLSERLYIEEFPQLGLVHPNTGLVRVIEGENIRFESQFKTDLEEIWDFYQNRILPETTNFLLKLKDKKKQPLFKKLEINIKASEPERKLLSREDMISTLNGLHEDIYFVGLDYFRTWGNLLYDKPFDEPGLILPKIKVEDGISPTIEASLELEEYSEPTIVINKTKKLGVTSKTNVNKIELVSIEKCDKGHCIKYEIECEQEAISRVKILQQMTNLGYSVLPEWVENIAKIIFIINKEEYILDLKMVEKNRIEIDQNEKFKYLESVIDFKANEYLINTIIKFPQFNIYTIAKSYLGRPIYAIEIDNYYQYDLGSFYKRRFYYNSLILNNRHHANEVSATNAAYKLLFDIGEGKLSTDRLNLALIPIENIDGVQIHYELMKENPNWKLHVARYNAVGKEIANDYFNKDSIYGECHALPRLYSRYLPEAFIDNHGVPSHEWDQQFSGYVSPWFKGFWLPRALYYGYFWYPEGDKYNNHKKFSEELAEEISFDLSKDKQVEALNKEWKSRFLKYANEWMPNQFPANYYKDLIYYWIPFEPGSSQRHFAPKFPDLTFIDMTTEVSDETAQGQYLQICSKALDISNRSIIEYVKNKNFTKS
ncbi:MAG: M14 family metallopeptidase [Clostridia bacterium]